MDRLFLLDHRRQRSIAFALVAVFTMAAPRAGAQAYTQTTQSRSMQVDVTARVPGQTDAVDGGSEVSTQLGAFDRSISAGTSATAGATSVAVQGAASQRVDYRADAISGLLAARIDGTETGGQSGRKVDSAFRTEFRVGANDLPYAFNGQVRGTFDAPAGAGRSALAEFSLTDLDMEDPHGGGTTVFALSSSSNEPFDHVRQFTGVLLAGHRYDLMAHVRADRELLENPVPPGAFERFGEAEASFALTLVPEPGCAAFIFCGLLSSLRNRRR